MTLLTEEQTMISDVAKNFAMSELRPHAAEWDKAGHMDRAKLVALMDLLQTRRDATNDARLEAALDEVETRAAVELAKFS